MGEGKDDDAVGIEDKDTVKDRDRGPIPWDKDRYGSRHSTWGRERGV